MYHLIRSIVLPIWTRRGTKYTQRRGFKFQALLLWLSIVGTCTKARRNVHFAP